MQFFKAKLKPEECSAIEEIEHWDAFEERFTLTDAWILEIGNLRKKVEQTMGSFQNSQRQWSELKQYLVLMEDFVPNVIKR